ncbi:AAA family ATPase [Adhaeribacter soli]|uniref:ATP-binding protein n=1 Tax=Adhaeribacter soli TaxID=2607655 RepID=A0A5N1J2C8_9BACT|nr:AAA family ATPase [Adhaeribacter soli]KAA9338782.1 ATP-binding protein [Adhaeribacter soli]
MFLKEIYLKNFKCHERLFLDFSNPPELKQRIRKTTFLLGENGTGKSALLKAIALVTGGSNALSDIFGDIEEWIQNGKDYCEIAAVLTTAEGELRNISLRLERGSHLTDVVNKNRSTLELIDNAIKNADRNYFVIAYGASRRLNKSGDNYFPNHSQRSNSFRSTNIRSLFNPDALLVSLSNWAMELDYSQGTVGLQLIKDALDNFLLENVKFKAIDKEKGKIIFSTPDGDVPLEQLSDGYQNVAAWIGDLMYNLTRTFKDYKEPLKARGLLLIDEIDLHLHPKWQRQLHAFLKDKLPNFQIIATTHSPLTAQQAEENELYALKREDGKVDLIAFKGNPSKMLIHQLLMSPVFGLQTDESLIIQEAKAGVREYRAKGLKSQKDKNELAKYEELLDNTPFNVRENSLLSGKDISLLQEINSHLKPKDTSTDL